MNFKQWYEKNEGSIYNDPIGAMEQAFNAGQQQYKSLVKTVDADNLPEGRILLNDNGFVSLGFLDFNKVNNEVRISHSNMTSFIVDKGAHYIEQKDLIKMISGV